MKFAVSRTLGLLVLAKEGGLISSLTVEVTRLQDAGLYLLPSLVARARAITGE